MYGIPNMKLDKNEVVLRRIKQFWKPKASICLQHRSRQKLSGGKTAEGIRRRHSCDRRDQAARSADSKAANSKAFISRWIFSPRTPRAFWIGTRTADFIDADRQGRRRHRRRRHRHGLRRHLHAARLQSRWCRWKFCRKPPLERAKDNPWPEWPKVYKLDYGQEEAAAKFGADPRVYLTTATKFEGDAHGHVKAVHTVQVRMDEERQGPVHPEECSRHGKSFARATGAAGDGFPRAGTAVARITRHRARRAHQRQGRFREIHDESQGRLCRRRLPPRPEPRRVGLQRRPRRRARMRPLSDGRTDLP